MSLEAYLTVLAILIGPMLGVYLTRRIDTKREVRNRKYSVLSDLMKTRSARLDPLHVSALNMIELEFSNEPRVIEAFSAYVTHLNSNWPSDPAEVQRHNENGDDLFAELLARIAFVLGFKFDKRDLGRRAYQPTGLANSFSNQLMNAQYLRELLEGRRPLVVRSLPDAEKLQDEKPAKQIEDKS